MTKGAKADVATRFGGAAKAARSRGDHTQGKPNDLRVRASEAHSVGLEGCPGAAGALALAPQPTRRRCLSPGPGGSQATLRAGSNWPKPLREAHGLPRHGGSAICFRMPSSARRSAATSSSQGRRTLPDPQAVRTSDPGRNGQGAGQRCFRADRCDRTAGALGPRGRRHSRRPRAERVATDLSRCAKAPLCLVAHGSFLDPDPARPRSSRNHSSKTPPKSRLTGLTALIVGVDGAGAAQ
jgi:hypothetical protein